MTSLLDRFHVKLEQNVLLLSLSIELDLQVGSLSLPVILDLVRASFVESTCLLVKSSDRDALDEVIRGPVGIYTLESYFVVGLSHSKFPCELPLGDLIVKLLHDYAHDFVTFAVDDHVGVFVDGSLLEVDHDEVSPALSNTDGHWGHVAQSHAGAHSEAKVSTRVALKSKIEYVRVAALTEVDNGVAHLSLACRLRTGSTRVMLLEVFVLD